MFQHSYSVFVLTEEQTDISESSKTLLSQFIRRHSFFSQLSTGQFTTSERRKFERDIYDFARASNRSQKHAREAISKARDFCEQGCDSDNSAWENEIDDSSEILKRLCDVPVTVSTDTETSPSRIIISGISNGGQASNDEIDSKGLENGRVSKPARKAKVRSVKSLPALKSRPSFEDNVAVDHDVKGSEDRGLKRKQSQLIQMHIPKLSDGHLEALPNDVCAMLLDQEHQLEELRALANFPEEKTGKEINKVSQSNNFDDAITNRNNNS